MSWTHVSRQSFNLYYLLDSAGPLFSPRLRVTYTFYDWIVARHQQLVLLFSFVLSLKWQSSKTCEKFHNFSSNLIASCISMLPMYGNWSSLSVYLRSQLCSASTCNQQLQQTLQCEKAQACRAIRELDCKVLGLQDSIMLKVREVSAAREVQTCLQSEIESYKMLLEREEKKWVRVLRNRNSAISWLYLFNHPVILN